MKFFRNQRGNVFFTLFGAVAVVGVLGAGIMSTMRGPLTTMVEINKIEEAKAEMRVSARLLAISASDQDGDTDTEPVNPASCSAFSDGCVPNVNGAAMTDPWGTPYAYCAWNLGSDNAAIGGTNIQAGDVNLNYFTMALISAGPDREFDTTCGSAPPSLSEGGDDLTEKLTYADAAAMSGGVWELNDTDSDLAEIRKNIQVLDNKVATFTGDVNLAGGTGQLQLGANSMLLPLDIACTSGNANILRVNTSAEPHGVEICSDVSGDGNFAWYGVAYSTGVWTLGSGNDIYYDTGTYQVGIGNNAPDDALDVTGNIGLTGNLEIDGMIHTNGTSLVLSTDSGGNEITINGNDVDIAGTMSVSDLLTASNGLTVTTGGATVTAGGLTVSAGGADITGNSDIDGTLTTTGALTVDSGGATITAGGLTVSADGADITGNSDIDGTLTTTGALTVDSGGATITAGGLTVSAGGGDITGTLEADDYTYGGIDFTPDDCTDGHYNRWDDSSGWECEQIDADDIVGGGGGAIVLNDLDDVSLTSPGADQCLRHNGSNWVNASCIDVSGGTGGGVFEHSGANDLVSPNTTFVDFSTDDFVFGSTQLDNNTGTTDDDRRMFFDKSTGSFRAGGTSGNQWDPSGTYDHDMDFGGVTPEVARVGTYSTAFGFNTTASGAYSTAFGRHATASGEDAFAVGQWSDARGTRGVAIGQGAAASNTDSIAIGSNAYALGSNSTAINAEAFGPNSIAMARGQAMSNHSISIGFNTESSGHHSIAMGRRVIAGSGTAETSAVFDGTAGHNTFALGLQSANLTLGNDRPVITGDRSAVFFFDGGTDNANANFDFTGSDHFALIGGVQLIDPTRTQTSVSTGGEQDLSLDIEGATGATYFCDEAGNNCFEAADVAGGGSGIFEIDSQVIRVKSTQTNAYDSDFVVGSDRLDYSAGPYTGPPSPVGSPGVPVDSRAFFDKSKGAFRAGVTYNNTAFSNGTSWDEANVGDYSFAAGASTTASGDFSAAFGHITGATGDFSTAFGEWSQATGIASTAMGQSTHATGYASVAMGRESYAYGGESLAMGNMATASGNQSIALGGQSIIASGNNSFVFGQEALAGSGLDLADADTDGITLESLDATVGQYSVVFGLGNSSGTAATHPRVTGDSSYAIFMGDQVNVDVTADNTFALLGGSMVIDPDQTSATNTSADTALDVAGSIKIGNGNELCNAPGHEGAIRYNSGNFEICATHTTPGWQTLSSADDAIWSRGSDQDIYYNDAGNPRVGIGTTSPESILDVNGTMRVRGDYRSFVTGSDAYDGKGDFDLFRGRGTYDSPAIVQDGDSLGTVRWAGHDGTDFWNYAASIRVEVDGTPGGDDMPGRILFQTTPDGDRDPVTNMVIKSDGNVGIGTTSPDSKLHLETGDIRLDGGAGNEAGCIRFNDTSDELEYADDCTNYSAFGDVPAGSAPGNDTEVIFNSSDNFAADSGMTYDSANDRLRVASGVTIGHNSIQATGTGSLAVGSVNHPLSVTTASGSGSIAFGFGNGESTITASGTGSFAGGSGEETSIIASGTGSFAFGDNVSSVADNSIVMGDGSFSSGLSGIALGRAVLVGDFTPGSGAGNGNYSMAFGLQSNTNVVSGPRVTGDRSAVFFFDGDSVSANSSYDFTESDKFALVGGEFVISETQADGAAMGCIRFNESTDRLQFSHDCSTYEDIGGASVFEVTGAAGSEVVRQVAAQAPIASADFVFGSTQLDNDTGGTDDDRRMFFDKSESAFRAGWTLGDEWDVTATYDHDFNGTTAAVSRVGTGSVGFGLLTTASGDVSTVMGFGTTASGDYATAMGYGTRAFGNSAFAGGNTDGITNNSSGIQATGSGSFAFGNRDSDADFITASGNGAVAFGNLSGEDSNIISSGSGSVAMGNPTGENSDITSSGTGSLAGGIALNDDSVVSSGSGSLAWGIGGNGDLRATDSAAIALGNSVHATGPASVALGSGTESTGAASTAMGHETAASGNRSTAMGGNTTASGFASTAMGSQVVAGSGTPESGPPTMGAGHGHHTFAVGLQSATQAINLPVISGDRSAVFFFDGNTVGANTNYDFDESDMFALIGAQAFQIDDDSSSDNKGCIRYNSAANAGAGALEFSHDCSAGTPVYEEMGSGGLWTDLTGGRIHYGDDGTQQVGIGTNNPTSTLHVAGGDVQLDAGANIFWGSGHGFIQAGDTVDVMTIGTGSSLNVAMTIDDTQFVGIGVADPAEKLALGAGQFSIDDVLASANKGCIRYNSAANAGAGALEFSHDCSAGTPTYTAFGSGSGGLWTDGTGDEIYYNTGTPLVGIGNASPDTTLDVEGGQALFPAPTSAPGDSLLANSQWGLWADESNNEFEVKHKDSGGTVEEHTLVSKTTVTGTSCSISVNNTQTGNMGSTGNSLSIASYAVPVVTSPMLIVSIAMEDDDSGSPTFSSVTFGGTPMTQAAYRANANSDDKVAAIYYLANPSGTGNIDITVSENVEALMAAAYTVECLKPQAPEATASAESPDVNATSLLTNITTLTDSAFIADVIEHGGNAGSDLTPGAGQTSVFTADTAGGASSAIGAGYRVAGTANTYNVSWSSGSTNNYLAMVAAAFETANNPTTNDANLAMDNLSDVSAGSPAANDLLVWTGTQWVARKGGGFWLQGSGDDIYYDATTPQVGIGTNSPSSTLHVYDSDNPGTSQVRISAGGGGVGTIPLLFDTLAGNRSHSIRWQSSGARVGEVEMDLGFSGAESVMRLSTQNNSGGVGGNTSTLGLGTMGVNTGNSVALELNYYTDKSTSGNDTGFLINKTDLNSPGTSLLLDAKTGGTTQFSVTDEGLVYTRGAIEIDGPVGDEKGCIRYNDTADQLEFSHDCSAGTPTYTAFGSGSGGLWTDLTGGRIHYGDDGTQQVGIGTDSPSSSLHVFDADNSTADFDVLQMETNGGGQFVIRGAHDDQWINPNFIVERARGSIASPTAVQDGDQLFEFVVHGHDGTTYEDGVNQAAATIGFFVDGTVSTDDVTARIDFSTYDVDDDQMETRMRINGDGGVHFLPDNDDTSAEISIEGDETGNAHLLLHTAGNYSATMDANAKHWAWTARGESLGWDTDRQEDLELEYWDGSGWSTHMFVDHDTGNVGLGQVNTDHALDIRRSSAAAGDTAAGQLLNVRNDGSGDSYAQIAVGDSTGGDPALGLHVVGTGGWLIGLDNSDSDKLKFSSSFDDLAGGAQMTLTTGGNLGIGTDPNVALDVSGDIEYTGTITDVSDRRLKDNVQPLESYGSMLEKIGHVDTYTFVMKDDKDQRTEFGVIAQELEEIFPELVRTADDEMGTKSVNYTGLIAPMIKATQELEAENAALRSELAALKAQQNDILQEVKGLKAHTGYGVDKAQIGFWILLGMLLSGLGFVIMRQRQGRQE